MKSTMIFLRGVIPMGLASILVACSPGAVGGVAAVGVSTVDASVPTSEPEPEADAAESCPAGRTACGPHCVSVDSDPLNCGACDMACGPGVECLDGVCVEFGCDPSEICDGACRDFRNDSNHCGACGSACDADQTCQGGKCLCPNGRAENCDQPPGEACGASHCQLDQFCSAAQICIALGTCAADGDCPTKKRCDQDTRKCTGEPWLTFERVDSAYKVEVNGVKLAFSYAGPISGMSCVNVFEGGDIHGGSTWGDNYMCSHPDIGLGWHYDSNRCSARSVRIYEPSEPVANTWFDNYLCYDSSLVTLGYTFAGYTGSAGRVSFNEPADTYWQDNILTVRPTPPGTCDLEDISMAECALDKFVGTTFPGGRDVSVEERAKLHEGRVSVHTVGVRDDGRATAKVTFKGESSVVLNLPWHPTCVYSYEGTFDVAAEYDAASKTATLRGPETPCPDIEYAWALVTPQEEVFCKHILENYTEMVEQSLCFRRLRLKLSNGGLALAAEPF